MKTYAKPIHSYQELGCDKLKRYKDARPTAHNSSEEGWQALSTASDAHRASDWKAISVIASYQYQASKR